MKNLKSLIYFVFFIAIGSGCKRENNITITHIAPNAIIINSGAVAADGCGWLVKIDSTSYHAENLPEEFQKDNLKVNVKYNLSGSKFQCGMFPVNLIPSIHINSIEKN